MLEHLRAELNDVEHTIEVIDIDLDGNEELLEQYDELVPVLYAIDTHGQAHQLCHYFLDRDKLTAYRLAQS